MQLLQLYSVGATNSSCLSYQAMRLQGKSQYAHTAPHAAAPLLAANDGLDALRWRIREYGLRWAGFLSSYRRN